ncbi:hypothetical protein KMT30_24445 [Streptomyces sp. IBSBF 2953]|nr:hypothetical protein [Streptomyces hayashii]
MANSGHLVRRGAGLRLASGPGAGTSPALRRADEYGLPRRRFQDAAAPVT